MLARHVSRLSKRSKGGKRYLGRITYHDTIAGLDILDVFPNLLDNAAKFVAHGQGYLFVGDGMWPGGHDARASEVLMQVYSVQQNN